MDITHERLPEGESTEKWANRSPGFMGSIKQLICCARCGEYIKDGPHTPQHFRDIFKPTKHVICHECNDALPE